MEVEAIWEWSLPFLSKKPILVLTGGEPLLYSHLLYRLVQLYPFPVLVETNGTIAPDFLRQPLWRRAEFVLSIKLSNSGEPAERRIKPSIIAQIGKLAPASYFKFVVNPFRLEEQREEIEEIRKYAPHLPVYLMPQGATLSQLEEGSSRVAQFALRYGYRYSDRLQLRLGLK
jgi:6-pyruvoyltetrahydropterin 2'-reductase